MDMVAWAAGLFEGEGFITWPKTKKTMVRLGLEITDLDVLTKFQLSVGCGTITGPKIRPNRKPIWIWAIIERDQVRKTLESFMPYFGERRKGKALLAFERLDENTRPKKAECGTSSGARRHYRFGEKPCEPCRLAWNAKNFLSTTREQRRSK